MKNINKALVVAESIWNKEKRVFETKFAARRTETVEIGKAGCATLVRDSLHGEYAMYDNEVLFDSFEEANRIVTDYNLLLEDDTVIRGRWNSVKREWEGVEFREESSSTDPDRERFYTP